LNDPGDWKEGQKERYRSALHAIVLSGTCRQCYCAEADSHGFDQPGSPTAALALGIGEKCIRISILAFDLSLKIVEISFHIKIHERVSGLEESLVLWSR
jgi:hypothetical protein